MEIIVIPFNQLTTTQLYQILQLRSEVFVVEQNCVYQDIDGKDQKATHILLYKDNILVGYTRCFAAGDYFKEAAIGRVIVKEKYRKFGYGHDLMKTSINYITQTLKENTIKLSAQTYLQSFYESHHFKITGKEYLEDGIPHIAMIRAKK